MTERDKRALIILGALVGAALVFFLVTQVLLGGEEEPAAAPAPAPAAGATDPTEPVPEPEPSETPTATQTPRSVTNFSGRDPFSTPPELISPTAVASDTTSPVTDPTTEPQPDNGTGPTSDDTSNVTGRQVTLNAVYLRSGDPKVSVEVEDKAYTKGVGEIFAQNYRVSSIDMASNCATFIYGDESFELCADAPS
ncbi:MAG: hypothetical protein WEA10_08815 [Actinomycetota bacterium]